MTLETVDTVDAVVAIDVGGTTLKGALVGAGGDLLARRDAPTPASEGGDAVVRAVVGLAAELAGLATAPVRVVAAAAITAGQVDPETGVVKYAANLGWRDVPLRRLLAARLGVPAAVDHDARGAGLAEALYGGGGPDCLFVTLGTGIGATHVRDGRVSFGATGGAGEVGHIPVYPDGELCQCGQRGCLEAYASAAAVGRRYAAASGGSAIGADRVVAGLGRDAVADRVWSEAVEALAVALATCTLLLDPAVVVLGGGLAGAGRTLVDPVAERLRARLAWRPPPPIVLATLGTDAGWLGASLRAWEAAGRAAPALAPRAPATAVGVPS